MADGGIQHDAPKLHRIFYATRLGRTLDQLGYVRFRHWRTYGERGLARRQAAVWLYGETVLLEFSDEPLAQCSVAYEPDGQHLKGIQPRQDFDTRYRAAQLPPWELGDGDWLRVARLARSPARRRSHPAVNQLAFVV